MSVYKIVFSYDFSESDYVAWIIHTPVARPEYDGIYFPVSGLVHEGSLCSVKNGDVSLYPGLAHLCREVKDEPFGPSRPQRCDDMEYLHGRFVMIYGGRSSALLRRTPSIIPL